MSKQSYLPFLRGLFERCDGRHAVGRRNHRLGTNSLRFERLENRMMLSAGGTGLSSLLQRALPVVQNLVAQTSPLISRLASQANVNTTASVRRLGADAFEADDTAAQAKTIATSGTLQSHTLDIKTDVDWVTFTVGQQSDVVIETRGTIGDTRMWLYSAQNISGPPQLNQVQFDDNGGVGQFSRIIGAGATTADAPAGHHALAAGTYYVKVDAAPGFTLPISYTLSVTALQPADVFLVKSTSKPSDMLVSTTIRVGEALQLNVPFTSTYFHSAMYLGQNRVAEMVATGFTDRTSLEQLYDHDAWIDVYRRQNLGANGQAVVSAIERYQGSPYAFSQLGVYGLATLIPNNPGAIKSSVIYATYLAEAYGSKRMICSELVARAFAEAQTSVPDSLRLSVSPWPSIARLGNTSSDFAMDFTSPTMLSLSSSLQRLNA
jgi:hypothetical protein